MRTGDRPSETTKWQVGLVLLLAAFALLSGCAATTPYRAHPQFEDRLRTGLTVALVPPDIRVYQLSAGDVRELMDEWSASSRRNVLAAVRKQMTGDRVLTFREFDLATSQAAREEFEDARTLFQAVALSATFHAYRPDTQFQTKIERFDYSLGPLPALAEASEADALLFIQAVDHVSSAGRVARNVALALMGVAAGVAIIPAGGVTAMTVALVDAHTGDVLWFNRHSTAGVHDLRDSASAEAFVADAFKVFAEGLPAGGPGVEKRP